MSIPSKGPQCPLNVNKRLKEHKIEAKLLRMIQKQKILAKLPKIQQRVRVEAKALQKEKGCKVRGEVLLYSSKAPTPLKLPTSTPK